MLVPSTYLTPSFRTTIYASQSLVNCLAPAIAISLNSLSPWALVMLVINPLTCAWISPALTEHISICLALFSFETSSICRSSFNNRSAIFSEKWSLTIAASLDGPRFSCASLLNNTELDLEPEGSKLATSLFAGCPPGLNPLSFDQDPRIPGIARDFPVSCIQWPPFTMGVLSFSNIVTLMPSSELKCAKEPSIGLPVTLVWKSAIAAQYSTANCLAVLSLHPAKDLKRPSS